MIADGGRNQTYLVRFSTPLGSLRQNVARRHHARRPVVVSGPAETTALRTAARDLDQKTIAHFGLRRPDAGRRREDFVSSQLVRDFGLPAANCAAQAAFFWILGRNRAADARRNPV